MRAATMIPDALVVDVGNALLGNDEAPEAWEAFNSWAGTTFVSTAEGGPDWPGIRTLVARALRWSRVVSPRGDKANRNALRSALASNRPGTARIRGITDARSNARAGEALYRALGPV